MNIHVKTISALLLSFVLGAAPCGAAVTASSVSEAAESAVSSISEAAEPAVSSVSEAAEPVASSVSEAAQVTDSSVSEAVDAVTSFVREYVGPEGDLTETLETDVDLEALQEDLTEKIKEIDTEELKANLSAILALLNSEELKELLKYDEVKDLLEIVLLRLDRFVSEEPSLFRKICEKLEMDPAVIQLIFGMMRVREAAEESLDPETVTAIKQAAEEALRDPEAGRLLSDILEELEEIVNE